MKKTVFQKRKRARKSFWLNSVFLGTRKFSVSFNPFHTAQGFLVFVLTILILSALTGAILPETKITQSQIIKTAQVKQTSAVIAGQPVTWSVLVKRSDISGSQKFVELPKNAKNIKIKTVPAKEAKAILAAKIPDAKQVLTQKDRAKIAGIFHFNLNGIDIRSSNTAGLAEIKEIVFRFFESVNNYFLADLEEAASNVVEQVVEAVLTETVQTEEAKLVDLIDEKLKTQNSKSETNSNDQSQKFENAIEEKEDKEKENKKDEVVTEQSPETSPEPLEDPTPQQTEPDETDAETPETPEPPEEPEAPEVETPELPETPETPILDEPVDPLEVVSPQDQEIVIETPSDETVSPADEPVVVEDVPDDEKEDEYVEIEYKTDGAKITEQETEKGKIVTVSEPEETRPLKSSDASLKKVGSPKASVYTDVLAYTTIPEIFKVGQERLIKVKWTNNDGQVMPFTARDLNDNGKIDYLEWTVPHLSEQIFEIIFISKAWKLDESREILDDIYETVKSQDGNWAYFQSNQYVRVTFQETLDDTKDITVYAKPTNPGQLGTIEVYTKDGNEVIATFPEITSEGTYKILLTNLKTPTDEFDLKILGNLDIDYIVDPLPVANELFDHVNYYYYLGPWVWDKIEDEEGVIILEHWRAPAGTVGLIDLRSIPDQSIRITAKGYGFFATTEELPEPYILLGMGDLREIPVTAEMQDKWEIALGYRPQGTYLVDLLFDQITNGSDENGANIVKPLIPDKNGDLKMYLGGHSLVKSAKIDWNSPHGDKVKKLIKNDLKRIRKDSKDGKMGRGGGGDTNFHRKYMKVLLEKYSDLTFEDLRPAGWPKEETPLPHNTTITDNFNRADADAMGSSSEGWSWTETQNDIDIVSNQAASQTSGANTNARAESDLSSDDHYSQAAGTQGATGTAYRGVMARFSSSAFTGYAFYSLTIGGSGTWVVYKWVAGAGTLLYNAGTSALSSTLKLAVDGNTLTGYSDGSVVYGPATDPGITGNTRCGLESYRSGSSILWDDFEAADLADSAAPTVSTLSPADDATTANIDANLVITFGENVDVETGNITIKKTSDNSTVETIDVTSGQVTGTGTGTITINPSKDLDGSTGYYVQIDATAFDDAASNSYAGIADTTTWSFTTRNIFDSGWTYRKKITIDNANVDADLTNFPVYIKLNADENIGDNAQNDGDDIRFTSSDGTTLLKYEEESWTGGAGTDATANYWVKVPTVATAADTDIYIYYGKAGAADNQDAANVWDSNFKGVWHLKETGTGSAGDYQDSTSSNNDSTNTTYQPTQSASGQIGGAQDFNATDDRIITSLDLTATNTITAWMRADSLSTYKAPFIESDSSNYFGLLTNGSGLSIWSSSDSVNGTVSAAMNTATWYYVALVREGDSIGNGIKLYANASLSGQANTGTWSSPAEKFWIGNQANITTRVWDGLLDEVRVSDTNRAAAWIKFEYNNMATDDNEISFGAQHDPSDTTPAVPSSFSPASASTITDATPTITFTTNENADCYASADGDETYDQMSDDTNCTGDGTTSQSCTLGDLGADGAKTVYVACQDTAGNKDTADTNEALSYTLDTTPPVPTITAVGGDSSSPYLTADTTPLITLTLNENGDCRASTTDETYAGMSDNYDCTGDGTQNVSCQITGALTDGSNTIYIACNDSNSNPDTADTNEAVAFTLDSTAPTTSDDFANHNTWQSSNQTITLTPADATSSVSWTKYCQDTDNTCAVASGTAYTEAVTISTEGTSYFRYASQDTAGNTQTTVSKTVKIDKTNPSTAADAGVYVFNSWSNANVTATLSCADTGSGCLATLYCTDADNTCTPATPYTTGVVISSAGTTYFRYYSTDNVGHSETTASQTVKVDKTNPSVNAGTDQTKKSQFTQDATTSDATSGIASYQWSKVSGSGTITFGTATTEDTTVSADTDDTYVIRLTVTDNASNSATDDFTLIWDATTATPSSFSPASASTITDATPTITFTTNENADCYASADGDETYDQMSDDTNCTGDGTQSQSCTLGDLGADGAKTVYVACQDTAGNKDDATTNEALSYTLDATAPTTSDDFANHNTWVSANQTITLTPTDATSSVSWTKYCQDTDNTCAVASGTAYTEAVTISTEGTSYFRYASQDTAGNTQTTVSKTVKIDKTNPIVSAGDDQSETEQFTQTGVAADSGSGILSYLWSKVSGSGAITFGTASATSTTISADTADTYVIRLTVTDNVGNSASDNFTLTWTSATPPTPTGGSQGQQNSLGWNGAPIAPSQPPVTPQQPNEPVNEQPNLINQIAEQIQNIGGQIKNAILPEKKPPAFAGGSGEATPVEEAVPKEAPTALQGWELMTVKPIRELKLNPINSDIGFFAEKLPKLSQTLKGLAIDVNKMGDVLKLGGLDLYMPGLTQTVLTQQEILKINQLVVAIKTPTAEIIPGDTTNKPITTPEVQPGQSGQNKIVSPEVGVNPVKNSPLAGGISNGVNPFAAVQGIPVAQLSAKALAKMPTDILFARAAGGLLDLNINLAVDKSGEVKQKVRVVSGKPMQLVIKPDKPAQKVTGYMTLIKSSAALKQENKRLGIASRLLNAALLTSLNPAESSSELSATALLLQKFEYKEIKAGVFAANITAPADQGEYQVLTVINYKDKNIVPKETELTAVVDPEGYVFSQMPDGRLRIKGAKVSVYWYNENSGKYDLWPAEQFLQQNPLITDETGKYSFLLPQGRYYLKAEAPGYRAYQGETFVVKENIGVHEDIELVKSTWLPKWFNWQAVIAILLFIIIVMMAFILVIFFKKGREK